VKCPIARSFAEIRLAQTEKFRASCGDSADSLASAPQYAAFLTFDVFYDKLAQADDRRDGIDVTLALALAPRKKVMPAPKQFHRSQDSPQSCP